MLPVAVQIMNNACSAEKLVVVQMGHVSSDSRSTRMIVEGRFEEKVRFLDENHLHRVGLSSQFLCYVLKTVLVCAHI